MLFTTEERIAMKEGRACPIKKPPRPYIKLLIHYQSKLIVDRHGKNGLLKVLLEEGGSKFKEAAKDAKDFIERAIRAVRYAPGPNIWKDKTDDEIAAEILRRIEEKKVLRDQHHPPL